VAGKLRESQISALGNETHALGDFVGADRAVELAVELTAHSGGSLTHILSAAFFAVSLYFVYRSFYGMRIRQSK
jgi:hypothetical protein